MHFMYFIPKGDITIKHEEVSGLDFLKKQTAKCDYETNEIKIKDSILKLHSYNKIILKPHSETIIRTNATNRNRIRVVQTEETRSLYRKLFSGTEKFFMCRKRNEFDR